MTAYCRVRESWDSVYVSDVACMLWTFAGNTIKTVNKTFVVQNRVTWAWPQENRWRAISTYIFIFFCFVLRDRSHSRNPKLNRHLYVISLPFFFSRLARASCPISSSHAYLPLVCYAFAAQLFGAVGGLPADLPISTLQRLVSIFRAAVVRGQTRGDGPFVEGARDCVDDKWCFFLQ